jgi:hypothetical protein
MNRTTLGVSVGYYFYVLYCNERGYPFKINYCDSGGYIAKWPQPWQYNLINPIAPMEIVDG